MHDARISTIITLCRERRFAIDQQRRIDNATRAFVRQAIGWQGSMTEAERKRLNAEAARIVQMIETGERGHLENVTQNGVAANSPAGAGQNPADTQARGARATKQTGKGHRCSDAHKRGADAGSIDGDGHRSSDPQTPSAAADEPSDADGRQCADDAHYIFAPSVVASVTAVVLLAAQTRSTWDDMRKRAEKALVAAAADLPARQFVADTYGFGLLGLALIVGEAGDLFAFANPGKLWKRMGVAPDPSYAMTAKNGREAIAKPRRRRSTLYTIGDALIKQSKKPNPYRELYLARKAYELGRDPAMTRMHAHRRAQRYMEKRLLRDLWRAWRDDVQKDHKQAA